MGDANAVDLYFAEETTWGTTPGAASVAMTQLPYTGSDLERNKQTVLSETIRSDRQRESIPDVGFSAGGGFDFELQHNNYDVLFKQAITSAAFVAETVGPAVTIAAVNATSEFTDTGNGFGNFVVGQSIHTTGFATAANNGIFLVTSVAAGSLGVLPAPTDETAGASVTVRGNRLRNAAVQQSVVVEKRFTDITVPSFEWLNGLRVASFNIDATAQQIITGRFDFLGRDTLATIATISSGDTAAPARDSLTSSANVARLLFNDAIISAGVRRVQFEVANNLFSDPQVTSRAAAAIGYGFIDVTGTIEFYMDDISILTGIEDHTSFSVFLVATDLAGNSLAFNIPEIKLSTGGANAETVNSSVVIAATFQSSRDKTDNFTINIDSLVA